MQNYESAPNNLPMPQDDGAADHLPGLHLPFAVLSDHEMAFAKGLELPTFHTNGMHLLKRLTLITKDAEVVAVKYPIFPSNSDAAWAVNWLKQHSR